MEPGKTIFRRGRPTRVEEFDHAVFLVHAQDNVGEVGERIHVVPRGVDIVVKETVQTRTVATLQIAAQVRPGGGPSCDFARAEPVDIAAKVTRRDLGP